MNQGSGIRESWIMTVSSGICVCCAPKQIRGLVLPGLSFGCAPERTRGLVLSTSPLISPDPTHRPHVVLVSGTRQGEVSTSKPAVWVCGGGKTGHHPSTKAWVTAP